VSRSGLSWAKGVPKERKGKEEKVGTPKSRKKVITQNGEEGSKGKGKIFQKGENMPTLDEAPAKKKRKNLVHRKNMKQGRKRK